ncbi:MAG: orotidine 5'-phosphate decarboxylase / HUMPS family protein [Desulfurococcaceae archaeon TW002]
MSAHRVLRSSGRTIVLAINYPPPDIVRLDTLLGRIYNYVSGIKIGLPYMLRYGLKNIANLISRHKDKYYFIADLKLADIADVMLPVVDELSEVGFHGVVSHAFVGYKGALEPLSLRVRELGMELFLQVSLPHEGAGEVIDRSYHLIKNVLNLTDASGLIVPASKGFMIKEIRSSFGKKHVILASGILRMGAKPGEGICSGADVEVVGRAITLSTDLERATKEIISSQRAYVESRKNECINTGISL